MIFVALLPAGWGEARLRVVGVGMTTVARRYLGTVILAGIVAGIAGMVPLTHEAALDLPHAILLLSLALFAALLVILRLVRPTREATSGESTLVLFGALLLTAPQTVLLVLAAVAGDLTCRPREQRPPWFVAGFNASQLVLAGLAAHVVSGALYDKGGADSAVSAVLYALPAVAVFAVVSYGLLWGVHRFVAEFDGGFLHLLATQATEEASLLMIVALARAAWAVQPWFILLAAGPMLFFWRLYRTVGHLESANAELLATQTQAIDSLVQALAARDNEVSGHSDRVAYSTSLVAQEMGIDPVSEQYEVIVRGALLHDVGKIAIKDAILHKPGTLTEDEWVEMRDHSMRGFVLVQSYPFLAPAAKIILSHHERWDGKGYPCGLQGEEIPLGSRIFAVADTFDAITAARPYRPPRTREEAVEEILRCSGTQFDPRVVECFLQVCDQFPIGMTTVEQSYAVARSA
jgi:putative nucleotidyltransferase with HDIG domain